MPVTATQPPGERTKPTLPGWETIVALLMSKVLQMVLKRSIIGIFGKGSFLGGTIQAMQDIWCLWIHPLLSGERSHHRCWSD